MLLCDTGVLLAAGNIKDQAHRACVRLLRQAEGPPRCSSYWWAHIVMAFITANRLT
jgi:predicted nucleic acid-binding protein